MDNIYVIGSGLFGSVLAERIASQLNLRVIVIEKRNHIGGNCFTFTDKDTGINCHKYGSHIFHTSNQEVIEYVSQFMKLNHYRHQVFTRHNGKIYQMPINLSTINKFFNKQLNPCECKIFLSNLIAHQKVSEPQNFEEQAISLIGSELYKAFIRGYTLKQWQRDPKDLPAYIIKRLPFRTNYCADYFLDYFQGIPTEGYTPFFQRLLNNPLIEVRLNTDFNSTSLELSKASLIIYTGSPDELFNYCFGKLEWRTLDFSWEVKNCSDFQGCAVLNEADEDIPYTRTHEFKHYHPENNKSFESGQTIICREFSREYEFGDIPYYPVDTITNRDRYSKYKHLAEGFNNLILGGRLGMYRYMDMDQTIASALHVFKQCKEILNKKLSTHAEINS